MRRPTTFHLGLLTELAGYADTDWRWLQRHVESAAARPCRDAEPATFFPPDGARFPAQALHAERARVAELCDGCPVRQECLAAALLRGETWGSWGGVAQPDYQMLQRLWRDQVEASEGAA
ncbi:WhiB family transcriptional regulator [Amycolatopsis sp. RTGN1]|uniref:WhiB family transcriptional regulator n=1 Tax=Amycolatopsis ponsaeliensis TaxID=2992142 RepID=UPI002550B015|nr:WhiB family transcriptional regulator [Amycolatopsis sp. RTGN1]